MRLENTLWKIPLVVAALLPVTLAILFGIGLLAAGCSGTTAGYDNSCSFGGEGLGNSTTAVGFFFLMFYPVSIPWLLGGLYIAFKTIKPLGLIDLRIWALIVVLAHSLILVETWVAVPSAICAILLIALLRLLHQHRSQGKKHDT